MSNKKLNSLIKKLSKNKIPLDEVLEKANITMEKLQNAHHSTVKKFEKFVNRAIERASIVKESAEITERMKKRAIKNVKKHEKKVGKQLGLEPEVVHMKRMLEKELGTTGLSNKELNELYESKFAPYMEGVSYRYEEDYEWYEDTGVNVYNFVKSELLSPFKRRHEKGFIKDYNTASNKLVMKYINKTEPNYFTTGRGSKSNKRYRR